MSGVLSAFVGTSVSLAVNALTNILITPTRQLGVFIPDCAVEEIETDRLVITEHPIETGANVSDHAYLLPTEIRLRWLWSNSAPANALVGGEDYAKTVYANLRTLQASRQPFEMYTGKRYYQTCLIAELTNRTDVSSEYSLDLTMRVRVINLVSTQSATVPVADQASQSPDTAPNTSPQANAGQQTANPAPTSILRSMAGSLAGTPIGNLIGAAP